MGFGPSSKVDGPLVNYCFSEQFCIKTNFSQLPPKTIVSTITGKKKQQHVHIGGCVNAENRALCFFHRVNNRQLRFQKQIVPFFAKWTMWMWVEEILMFCSILTWSAFVTYGRTAKQCKKTFMEPVRIITHLERIYRHWLEMFHPFIICHNVFMNHPPLLVKYDVFLLNLFLTLRGIHLYLSLSLSLAHSLACVFKAREQSAAGANKRML